MREGHSPVADGAECFRHVVADEKYMDWIRVGMKAGRESRQAKSRNVTRNLTSRYVWPERIVMKGMVHHSNWRFGFTFPGH